MDEGVKTFKKGKTLPNVQEMADLHTYKLKSALRKS